MVEVIPDEVAPFGAEAIAATISLLQVRTEALLKTENEEQKEGEYEGLNEPLAMRWAKESLMLVTQHLTEQQKISLLSEQLTLLTYQPQEALNDEVNFKEELRSICDKLTFEVEQKELAVLAAPTRLQQKRQAVESVFNKFQAELEQVEGSFQKPQIDREAENQTASALEIFREGYDKFIQRNQEEVDDIEFQQSSFREGKRELLEQMRTLIEEFKTQVRKSSLISLRSLFTKNYYLTPIWGLNDQNLIRGSNIWPSEEDFGNVPTHELKNLQLSQISYYKVGSILSMQFTLSNGMTSPFAGKSGIDRCNSNMMLPRDRQIRKIRIKASKNWVNEIRFCDEKDYPIGEVKADSGVGEWHDIVLEKGERIIGFQEEHDAEQYVRRFGFVTFKP